MWGYVRQRGGCVITYNGQMVAESQSDEVAHAIVCAMQFIAALTPNKIIPSADGIAQREKGMADALVAQMGLTLDQVTQFANLVGAVDAVRQRTGGGR